MMSLMRFGIWSLVAVAVAGCSQDSMMSGGDPDLASPPDLATPMGTAPVKVTGFKQPSGAYFDAATSAWYVSNLDGDPSQVGSLKDNKAAITQIPVSNGNLGTADHAFINTGLSAPVGMRIHNGHLYVGDVDQLVVIRLSDKTAVARSTAVPGQPIASLPGFLMDVTVDPADGVAYAVNATRGSAFRFANPMTMNNTATEITNQLAFAGPTSIYLDGSKLVVTEAGINMVLNQMGGISTINKDGTMRMRLVTSARNNLAYQGLEKDGATYLAGSPGEKEVFRIDAQSGARTSLVNPGSDGAMAVNDIGWDPTSRTLGVPDGATNTVFFYKLP
jgi:hypothetical protein